MNIPGKWIIFSLTIGLVGLFGWNHLTKPLGDQKVSFVPALREAGTDGPLRYCVYRAPGGVNGDILYHLPGRNLDEQIWNDNTYFTAMIQAQWADMKVKPPTVVCVSYGPVWLLAPKGRSESSGLQEDFLVRMERIEARIGKPARRILMGESMGGSNALILALSRPGRFAKVAALSPGVYVNSPFGFFSELKAAVRRTGADPKTAIGILLLARKFVGNDKEWAAISPIQFMDTADRSFPELYLSCGLYDKFGNFEGCSALAEKARFRGVSIAWHPMYGGHGAIDVPSLAEFLVRR